MKQFYNIIISKDSAHLVRSIASLANRLAVLLHKHSQRFEANRIAEEKRNFELTKKYNLLEFV